MSESSQAIKRAAKEIGRGGMELSTQVVWWCIWLSRLVIAFTLAWFVLRFIKIGWYPFQGFSLPYIYAIPPPTIELLYVAIAFYAVTK